jgi:hypothetical protein
MKAGLDRAVPIPPLQIPQMPLLISFLSCRFPFLEAQVEVGSQAAHDRVVVGARG